MPASLTNYEDAVAEIRCNAEQSTAFDSTGHCVMLAGPGSGKTKVLTTKLARVLREDIRLPRGVACVTYNNECVRELERRLERLGAAGRRNLFIGTLHAFCLRIVLNPYATLVGIKVPRPLVVASERLQRETLEAAMAKVGVRTPGFGTDLNRFRRTAIDREEGVDGWETGDRGLTDVCLEYESLLRDRGRIDFEDIVTLAVRAIETNPIVRKCLRARFPILLVDEYQDLGVPLHRMVLTLCLKAGIRLFAVGDPDQSIYGFTGARPDLLRELADHPEVEKVDLLTNYRSGRRIVSASEVALGVRRGFSAHSKDEGRVEFKLCADGLDAQARHVVEVLIPDLSARGELYGQIAVLYPTQQEGDALERGMLDGQIPFVRLDRGAGYRRTPLIRLVEDLAAWCCGGWRDGTPPLSGLLSKWHALLRGLPEGNVRESRRTLVRFAFANRDPSGLCGVWLGRLDAEVFRDAAWKDALEEDEHEAFAELLKVCATDGDLAELDVGMFAGKSGSSRHVVLMNLHTAKGTEFNNVIIIGLDSGRMPLYRAQTAEDLAEQRRLFFVGVSRARRELYLLYSGWTQNRYGRRFNDGPSPYVVELQRQLK